MNEQEIGAARALRAVAGGLMSEQDGVEDDITMHGYAMAAVMVGLAENLEAGVSTIESLIRDAPKPREGFEQATSAQLRMVCEAYLRGTGR